MENLNKYLNDLNGVLAKGILELKRPEEKPRTEDSDRSYVWNQAFSVACSQTFNNRYRHSS